MFILSACSSSVVTDSGGLPTGNAGPTAASATTPAPTLGPTEAPSATPTSTSAPTEPPTTAPAPTEAPTAAPTATPQPTTEDASQAVGACAHRYLPVAQGASWEYRISGSSNSTFTRVIADVRPDGFDDYDTFEVGATRASSWACRNGDLIALTPQSNSVVTAADMQSDFTVESNEGVTLPADPEPGQSWTQKVVYRGEQLVGGVTLKSRNVVETSCKAADIEAVIVPAGEFETLRVNCKTTFQITLSGGPAGLPGLELNVTETRWLAPGVGLVKSSSSSDMGATEIVLLAYRAP